MRSTSEEASRIASRRLRPDECEEDADETGLDRAALRAMLAAREAATLRFRQLKERLLGRA